jgi:hypothetical protein
MRRLSDELGPYLVVLLTMGTVVAPTASAFAQSPEAESAAEILKKAVEVNDLWLNPKSERLSYVVTATLSEQPYSINRVWIDGRNIRWEMDRKREDPGSYALVIRGKSATYVKGPEIILNKTVSAGDLRPFRQGITWRTAIHAIQQQGIPDDARVIERKKGNLGDIAVIEMTFPCRPDSVPDQRLNVGLGLRHVWLGQTTMPMGKVRLHIFLPDHFPILEEYPERNSQIRYGEEPLRFGNSLAPSSITYTRTQEAKSWELAASFKKHDSVWLLEKAENRQEGKLMTTLRVSDVSTAPQDKSLFEVPAK